MSRPAATNVPCPTCSARRGEPCRRTGVLHGARVAAYRAAAQLARKTARRRPRYEHGRGGR